jgi:hypothetical protein
MEREIEDTYLGTARLTQERAPFDSARIVVQDFEAPRRLTLPLSQCQSVGGLLNNNVS